LARYVTDEYKDKEVKQVDASKWEKELHKNIPRQGNSSDCGVFMLMFTDFKVRFRWTPAGGRGRVAMSVATSTT
jgi:Ulp1 family protease